MNNINGYKRYHEKPNTIVKGGKVYIKEMYFNTLNEYKNRKIRVYLPSTYDFSNPDNRFPVIYMLDGKNLFDDYTSFVGEWGVDEAIEKAIKENKTNGIIVVGIDAPEKAFDRALEMIPKGIELKDNRLNATSGYAELLGDFIFKEVKPDIDQTFYTLSDKNHTGVGGSSMGGLMSFYLAVNYSTYVNYSLPFSPAFFLFKQHSFKKYLEDYVSNNNEIGKMFLYVGDNGFESQFVSTTFKTYRFMRKAGFSHESVKLVYDSDKLHHENSWKKYFPEALEFFNYLK